MGSGNLQVTAYNAMMVLEQHAILGTVPTPPCQIQHTCCDMTAPL